MSFEARLSPGKLLKQLVEAIKDLIPASNITISPKGIQLEAMDNNHVCLAAVRLRADGFDHFQAKKTVTIGVSLESLSKVLKLAGDDDDVTLKMDEKDKLTVLLESPQQTRISLFKLNLLDIEAERLNVEDSQGAAVVELQSLELKRILHDLQPMGDTLTTTVNDDGVRFETRGDVGTASVVLKPDEESTVIQAVKGKDIKAIYALRYLVNFTKASPLSKWVSLSVFEEQPLKVRYELEGLGDLRLYLAPKISDDQP